jgi:aspartyl-tRNA(Asn)/glutamyl-tRNA(Gln) amidotransferase subunit C
MPDDLTLAEVERVAALARLALTAEEKSLYLGQLARILDYARQISDLDTGDVPPTASVLDAAMPPRPDEVRPSLGAARALANAPDQASGLFRVPKVLGDA